jgi:hypothetical protein
VEAKHSAEGGGQAGKGLEMLRERVRMIDDESAYLRYFKTRWSGEPVFCDVTPAYYALPPEDFVRMRDFHRSVKFLLVLRNPIDRFWSELRMKKKYDPQFDVIARLDVLLGRQASIWSPGYKDAIEKLDALIQPDAAKILFFEGMFTTGVLNDLCDFLGIPPSTEELGPPLNEGEPQPLDPQRRARLYKQLEDEYRFVSERFGGSLPESWRQDMNRFS